MAAGCTEQSEDVCVEVGAQQLACQYAVIWQGGECAWIQYARSVNAWMRIVAIFFSNAKGPKSAGGQ
jgi:hypothetical protein